MSVIGNDFEAHDLQILRSRGIDLAGVEAVKNGRFYPKYNGSILAKKHIMREFTEQFFDLLLDLDDNWRVSGVRSDYKNREVFIDIEHTGKQAECPKTLDLCGVYDHAPERKWRHLDILDYRTYLVCRLPRVKNQQEKVITVKPPWGLKGVSFSYQFEEKVINALQATKNQTKAAELMNCSFNMVNRIMHNSVERGMERRP